MKLYLVENCENSPGKITAIFRHEKDARKFKNLLEERHEVRERNLQEGQPPYRGYNL